MYLISLYFDDKSDKDILSIMGCIEKKTKNTYITDNKIPPHLTVTGFYSKNEEQVKELFEEFAQGIEADKIELASIAAFNKKSIHIDAVLSRYLHEISVRANEIFTRLDDVKFMPFYMPFGWIPHVTLAKHLTEDEMKEAFAEAIRYFSKKEVIIKRIGLSKTNPYREIKSKGLCVSYGKGDF